MADIVRRDTDLLLVNRDGVDYCAKVSEVFPSVCDLEELPMPWEDHDGGIYHIRNIDASKSPIVDFMLIGGWSIMDPVLYDMDGNLIEPRRRLYPGEEVVFLTPPDLNEALFQNNMWINWEFGPLTDVSKVVGSMAYMFQECDGNYTGISNWDVSGVTGMAGMLGNVGANCDDISGWDVSNVTNMDRMFYMSKFNQDLSGWCVSKIPSEPEGFAEGTSTWKLPKPVWGTCPRGEDGKP